VVVVLNPVGQQQGKPEYELLQQQDIFIILIIN
jgi:hypothetical protein